MHKSQNQKAAAPGGKARGRCLENVDVLVLAGGLGTRIQPVLGDQPKLLAPVAGRPYLAHLLDWLGGFGASRVVLGLGHLANPVLAYLQNNQFPGIRIETVVEPSPLGTAGAIRFARTRLKSDPVLAMNGDSFVDADLCILVERHKAAGSRATLLCTEIDDTSRYGRVVIDDKGYIQNFSEKEATSSVPGAISAGVYLLSALLLDEIAAGSAVSLERDVFAHQKPGDLAALVGPYRFVDIGTPESLLHAAASLPGKDK